MSKYYKAEDIQKLITACMWRMTLAKERGGEGFVEYDKQIIDVGELRKRLNEFPTIEVSEDNEPTWEQVKEYCFKRNFAIVGRETPKEYLRGFAEASEDAISREWVSVNMLKHGFHAPDMTVGEFLADAPSVIPQPKEGEWIPCSERLPNEGEVVLVCMRIESHKAEWEEQRSIEFGRISSDRYDYNGTGWEWLNESGADYWQADWNNSILAWMPLPKPWKAAPEEEMLIDALRKAPNKDMQALLLQTYIQEYGALSDANGEIVRQILMERAEE